MAQLVCSAVAVWRSIAQCAEVSRMRGLMCGVTCNLKCTLCCWLYPKELVISRATR